MAPRDSQKAEACSRVSRLGVGGGEGGLEQEPALAAALLLICGMEFTFLPVPLFFHLYWEGLI